MPFRLPIDDVIRLGGFQGGVDNVVLNAGSGGATVATDDVGTVHFQKIKLDVGGDGVSVPASGDAANGLDVDPTDKALRDMGKVDVALLDQYVPVDLDEGAGTLNALPVTQQNRIASGALNALNAAVTLPCEGCRSVTWEIDTGTLVGTVLFEATLDDTTFFGIKAIEVDGTIITSLSAFGIQGALTSVGYSKVRLRVSSFTSGTSNARMEGSAGGEVVRLGQAIPPGTNNMGDVDVLTMPTGATAAQVQGTVALDAVAAQNPVPVGGRAETMADSAPGTRVGTDGDRTELATDPDGVAYVHPHGPQTWTYHSNGSAALTDASVHAAPGAGLSLYVTDIQCSLGAATALNIFFEEGVTTVLGPWYLEAVNGRGISIQFQTPKKITANTALTVTTSAAVAHSVDVQGFIAPG